MKIFDSKKSGEEMSNWFWWKIFALVAVPAVVLFMFSFFKTSVTGASEIPKSLEEEYLLISRFYDSPDCFAYQDEVGRVHPGVIDTSKFKQENMDKCFPESDAHYAYYLSLKDLTYGSMDFGDEIKTSNWVEEGAVIKELGKDILLFYDGKKHNGELKVKIKNVR